MAELNGRMIEAADGSKVWQQGEVPKEVKPSKKNLELARSIIEKFADVTKHERGYDVDLIGIIGVRHEHVTQKESEATEAAATKIAVMLEKGELVLSDTWIKDNIDDDDGNVKDLTAEQ